MSGWCPHCKLHFPFPDDFRSKETPHTKCYCPIDNVRPTEWKVGMCVRLLPGNRKYRGKTYWSQSHLSIRGLVIRVENTPGFTYLTVKLWDGAWFFETLKLPFFYFKKIREFDYPEWERPE